MAKRKPKDELHIKVDKLPDLMPTDILVFSTMHHLTTDQAALLRSKINDLLTQKGITNRHIALTADMMLNVIRVDEP